MGYSPASGVRVWPPAPATLHKSRGITNVPVAELETGKVERNEIPDELLQRLFARISEISSLPAVALQIVQLADDPLVLVVKR